MIVADAGPLIALARVGQLGLLRQVAVEVAIPDAVYRELMTEVPGRPGSAELAQAAWLLRRQSTQPLPAPELHEGEREAIALARHLRLPLLIDEKRGRRLARRLHLQVFGTLGLLAEAKRQGVVQEVRPVVEGLIASGYWIAPKTVSEFLTLSGE
ncbi:MAG: DUF3368 domain-containing protein [Chloroflexi bacterium]|nr:DUF3368 domain-containing protein [Chloroflexota bacterium]